jgi:hypothetical protein
MTKQEDLTALLRAWSDGDGDALAVLAPLVHQELRELARRILSDERRDGAVAEPRTLLRNDGRR